MLYNIAKGLVYAFMRVVFRVRVKDKERFPKEGPVIVAINHTSYWDVPLVASVLPRKLRFMAKRDLFDIPFLRALMKWVKAFPVSRGTGGAEAIRAALEVLEEGSVVAIFPEGRRVLRGMAHTAKPGVALIAEKSGAPILPVSIGGGYRLFSRVTVSVGEPMWVKAPEGERLTTEECKQISARLLDTILQMAGEA